ncbi:hypothetical protein IKA15_00350 [bacterium]|nr:hypothetical protein [bacterium]
MKKIALFFLIYLFFQNVASAFYQLPTTSLAQKHWGIGVVQVPGEILVHREPNVFSEIIFEIKTEGNKILCDSKECENSPFVAFYPEKKYAFLVAEDEQEGWAQVYCNQPDSSFGWVKLNEDTIFYTWAKFLNLFGRRHGLYLFKDVKKKDKILFAQPFSGSQSVDKFEYPKHISPWYVSGNFVMVKLLNYDNVQKTGWLRWRTDNGELMLFPDFKH